MTTESPPQDTGRGGGARRRRTPERGGRVAAAPAGQPQSPFPPLDLVSRDELESIHQAALQVLREIGIDFLHDEARAMLKSAGADVDPASRRVRFDPALIEAHIGLPEGIHPPRAQPGAQAHDRGASPRVRLGGERAQFVRPRGRATAGQ
jgi:trimethylamine---corrinoid protein Co-methyltransferase